MTPMTTSSGLPCPFREAMLPKLTGSAIWGKPPLAVLVNQPDLIRFVVERQGELAGRGIEVELYRQRRIGLAGRHGHVRGGACVRVRRRGGLRGGLHGRRRGRRNTHLYHESRCADLDPIARRENLGLADLPAVDEGPVRGAQVLDREALARARDPSMLARDLGILA